eukprot:750609-Hanusia_phi.AAC.7
MCRTPVTVPGRSDTEVQSRAPAARTDRTVRQVECGRTCPGPASPGGIAVGKGGVAPLRGYRDADRHADMSSRGWQRRRGEAREVDARDRR